MRQWAGTRHGRLGPSAVAGGDGSRGARATGIGGIRDGNRSPGRTRAAPIRGYSGLVYDEMYKRLFAFPRMVEDLLRGFVRGEWVEEVDFSTLRKLSAEYVGEELRRR